METCDTASIQPMLSEKNEEAHYCDKKNTSILSSGIVFTRESVSAVSNILPGASDDIPGDNQLNNTRVIDVSHQQHSGDHLTKMVASITEKNESHSLQNPQTNTKDHSADSGNDDSTDRSFLFMKSDHISDKIKSSGLTQGNSNSTVLDGTATLLDSNALKESDKLMPTKSLNTFVNHDSLNRVTHSADTVETDPQLMSSEFTLQDVRNDTDLKLNATGVRNTENVVLKDVVSKSTGNEVNCTSVTVQEPLNHNKIRETVSSETYVQFQGEDGMLYYVEKSEYERVNNVCIEEAYENIVLEQSRVQEENVNQDLVLPCQNVIPNENSSLAITQFDSTGEVVSTQNEKYTKIQGEDGTLYHIPHDATPLPSFSHSTLEHNNRQIYSRTSSVGAIIPEQSRTIVDSSSIESFDHTHGIQISCPISSDDQVQVINVEEGQQLMLQGPDGQLTQLPSDLYSATDTIIIQQADHSSIANANNPFSDFLHQQTPQNHTFEQSQQIQLIQNPSGEQQVVHLVAPTPQHTANSRPLQARGHIMQLDTLGALSKYTSKLNSRQKYRTYKQQRRNLNYQRQHYGVNQRGSQTLTFPPQHAGVLPLSSHVQTIQVPVVEAIHGRSTHGPVYDARTFIKPPKIPATTPTPQFIRFETNMNQSPKPFVAHQKPAATNQSRVKFNPRLLNNFAFTKPKPVEIKKSECSRVATIKNEMKSDHLRVVQVKPKAHAKKSLAVVKTSPYKSNRATVEEDKSKIESDLDEKSESNELYPPGEIITQRMFWCCELGCPYKTSNRAEVKFHISKVHKGLPREYGPIRLNQWEKTARKSTMGSVQKRQQLKHRTTPNAEPNPLIWRSIDTADALLQLTAVARVELDELPVHLAPHKRSFHAKYADELMAALLKHRLAHRKPNNSLQTKSSKDRFIHQRFVEAIT